MVEQTDLTFAAVTAACGAALLLAAPRVPLDVARGVPCGFDQWSKAALRPARLAGDQIQQ